MAGLTIRPAGPADHAALERLFRETTMGNSVRLRFERDPDYFAGSRVQAEEPCVWGAFEGNGRAVGLFSAGARRVWLGGEKPMRYLSDLRIHPDWRGSSLLARGFRALRHEVFEAGEWAQTLVLEDNLKAMEALTSKRGGLPEYRPAGRYVSWLLPQQRIEIPQHLRVRRAGVSDFGQMQALLDAAARRRSFAGLMELGDLNKPAWRDLEAGDFVVAIRSGSIVGMMAIWDQDRFQRLCIDGYSKPMTALRPLWNLVSRIPLPRPGSVLPLLKASVIACENDDPEILRGMLSAGLSGMGGGLLLVGMSEKDPLCAAMRGLKGRRDFGRHFLVGWDGTPPTWKEPFAFDVARI